MRKISHIICLDLSEILLPPRYSCLITFMTTTPAHLTPRNLKRSAADRPSVVVLSSALVVLLGRVDQEVSLAVG